MENQEFFETLDRFFAENQIEAAGAYLEDCLSKARQENNLSLEISVLNEMMGYYRSTDQEQKGISSVSDGLALIEKHGLEKHPAVAAMWINMGTTLCHFNRVDEAEICYQNAMEFLKEQPSKALTMAGFYNNTAAVYVKTERFEEARSGYEKALELLKSMEGESELWEDVLFNRIVTWLNILVLNQVEISKTDSKSKEMTLKEQSEILLKQIRYALQDKAFQQSSSYHFAVHKAAVCFENLEIEPEWLHEFKKIAFPDEK